jgi:hypothetical protein
MTFISTSEVKQSAVTSDASAEAMPLHRGHGAAIRLIFRYLHKLSRTIRL